ncbi:MAG: chorismate-binding protein [Fimbriimonadaceae bacterium]
MLSERYARSLDEVIPLIEEAERDAREGKWTVLVVTFDSAPAFDASYVAAPPGLDWFAVAQTYGERPANQIRVPKLTSSIPQFQAKLPQQDYLKQIQLLKQHIARGDTYQVNYTFPLECSEDVYGADLFDLLCFPQPPPYARYLKLADQEILCLSPELFFEYTESEGEKQLRCRPMKGTRARGRGDDAEIRAELQASEKDRAENLMVVDMVRNDLSRIAITGSVHVPQLFEIEEYPTVWQMTSTVECRSRASLVDIFRALFPCASIVGAPKIETLRIIKNTESYSRGVYTGAIGIVGPNFAEICVAIRTMVIDKAKSNYSVGSGIVWDSEGSDEWAECLAKARILEPFEDGLKLVETMFCGSEIFLLAEHLQRLKASADVFGFPFDEGHIVNRLKAIPSLNNLRVRLTLDAGGNIEIASSEVSSPPVQSPPLVSSLRARLATRPLDSSNPWLRHKTTYRPFYEAAGGHDDVLHYNEKGHLTEFSIGNLVLDRAGVMVTPTLEDGLLAGVYRQSLLSDGAIKEARLTLEDLHKTKAAYRINSVRGWERVDF